MRSPPLPAVREPNELRAIGQLMADALGGGVGLVRDVHKAAADRPFGLLGMLGLPARVMHDAISAGVYTTLRTTTSGAGRLAAAATTLLPPQRRTLSASREGRLALGALNGAIGDRLLATESEAAIDMALRVDGRDVPAEKDHLASVYPDATSRLVVFVHGLCESDEAWGPWPGSFGSRLHAELGYAPIQLRYNSGLRISENGRALARLLERTVDAWPEPVDEIVLVGHSMGGLVVRSACHHGHTHESCAWTSLLRHVFCLGAPHLGAPLEQAANVGGWALGRLAETRPFANVVNGRSVGIKDLRYGSLVEEDWFDCDPDELLNDRCCDVPFLENTSYYFIGATLSRQPDSPLAKVVGDLLVTYPSASGEGRRRRIPFEAENGRHFGGMTHFHLLRHPAVYEQLSSWLAPSPH